ncbi:MAG: ribonuclease P protein component [Planctomycetes bacterium]|nr:ribonuclease P protein component [Planctomycetota bacterium]
MSAPKRFRLSRRFRLRRRAEFQRVMAHGQRVGDVRLQIWVLPNNLDHSRLGLIVGRQHGNAVRRHRIKRILREAFRLSRERWPSGLDLACAPRVGTKIELQDTIESLAKLTKRLTRKFASE